MASTGHYAGVGGAPTPCAYALRLLLQRGLTASLGAFVSTTSRGDSTWLLHCFAMGGEINIGPLGCHAFVKVAITAAQAVHGDGVLVTCEGFNHSSSRCAVGGLPLAVCYCTGA